MIVRGIVLQNQWWSSVRMSSMQVTAAALNPENMPTQSGVLVDVPSTEMADRAGRDWAGKVGLSIWALAIGTVSLPLATAFRVMAWGSGTAGSQVGSVTPQGVPGSLGYDESGYHIGAGHPDYASQNW